MLYRYKVTQQWAITTYFNGTTLMTVQADSEEEAKEKIRKSIKDSNGECDDKDLISEVYDPKAPLYWYSWSLWLHPDHEVDSGEPVGDEPTIEHWDPILNRYAQIEAWRNKAIALMKKIEQANKQIADYLSGAADLEGDELPGETLMEKINKLAEPTP